MIDYASTLPYVDENRIGAAGICAGGDYSVNAAMNDHRIKAVGVISTVNISAMYRNGWDGAVKNTDAMPLLMMCSTAPGYALSRSLTQLVTYDVFNYAEAFLVQPLQIVVGSESVYYFFRL